MKGICVFILVLCVCLSLVSPTLGRRRTTKTPHPKTMGRRRSTTTPGPTTMGRRRRSITTTTPPVPRGACVVDGQLYYEGASISRDSENCYGRVCMGGSVTPWDDRCFLIGQPDCDGQLVDIPGQCCHECITTPPPPTTTPETTPDGPTGVCIVNGRTYMNGEPIEIDPEKCYGSMCMEGSETFWDDKCFLSGQSDCHGQLVDIPGQCCHECITTTTPPTTTPKTTPDGPTGVCIVNGRTYMDGEPIEIDPEKCYGSKCMEGSVIAWVDKCFLDGQPKCHGELVDIKGQCCHECVQAPTTPAPPTTSP